MKYLSDIIQEDQNAAFKEANVIFAFSEKQFNEQKQDGIVYTNLGGGMLCNKEKAAWLVDELYDIVKRGVKKDVELHGIEAVVKRELANHEAYYTGEVESTMEALDLYPVDREYVLKIMREEAKNIPW